MKRILLIIALMLSFATYGYCIDQWTPTFPQAGDSPQNWPANEQTNNNSLSRILNNYRQGEVLAYTSASAVSASAGEVSCNSATPIVMRQNTSATAVNSASLDTGSSFSASTTYYVYANCDASATTNTFTVSLSGTAPTAVTNYKKIGSFTTDGSSNILASSVNANPSGPLMADTNGNKPVQGIFDYNTSSSAYTFKTGALIVAYGTTGSIGAGSSSTITNLSYTSSSSYVCQATINSSGTSGRDAISVSNISASSFGVYNPNTNASYAATWVCLGT